MAVSTSYRLLHVNIVNSVERRHMWRCWRRLSRRQRRYVSLLVVALFLAAMFTFLMQFKQDAQRESSPSANSQFQPVSNSGIADAFRKHKLGERSISSGSTGFGSVEGRQHTSKTKPNETPKSPTLPRRIRFPGAENDRQRAVVVAFKHAWSGYRRYAWGYDHLRPLTRSGGNWLGLGLTLVDSLDTMLIMGLDKEFEEARDWVAHSLNFTANKYVNLFETTIRVLGGLLSVHHISGDRMFLDKAVDLGHRLLPAFETRTGIPLSDVNLGAGKARGPAWVGDSTTAEVSTLQLEMNQLSHVSGLAEFSRRAMNVSRSLHRLVKGWATTPAGALLPIFISPRDARPRSSAPVTLGARGDSYYEYLLKVFAQLGEPAAFMRDDFERAMQHVYEYLLRRTHHSRLTFIGELSSASQRRFSPKMDHLVCFLPGTLALAVRLGLDRRHMIVAEQLLHTCYLTYQRQPTGLAAEITHFRLDNSSTDFYVKKADSHCLLRPETVESLWYLYHLTANSTYQDWGWRIFEAIERHARVPSGGYASLSNVMDVHNVGQRDSMESFFTAETLKYLYLLFSDDQSTLNLNDFVFNSEAHPLPVLRNQDLTSLNLEIDHSVYI